jgi:hypothetical protein
MKAGPSRHIAPPFIRLHEYDRALRIAVALEGRVVELEFDRSEASIR